MKMPFMPVAVHPPTPQTLWLAGWENGAARRAADNDFAHVQSFDRDDRDGDFPRSLDRSRQFFHPREHGCCPTTPVNIFYRPHGGASITAGDETALAVSRAMAPTAPITGATESTEWSDHTYRRRAGKADFQERVGLSRSLARRRRSTHPAYGQRLAHRPALGIRRRDARGNQNRLL